MKKVLIISYYWPPSGGAGVQRWVKLSKYLQRKGLDPVVLTVDEKYASYPNIDETLLKEVPPSLRVIKTKSFEPLNLYARIVGKQNLSTAGFANIKRENLVFRIAAFLRSHLFYPDPRRGWNRYAFRQASNIIVSEKIDTVLTSSPPHSTQLLGYRLKRKYGIKWLSDMRDPWTDIYYYKKLGHSAFSAAVDRYLEKKVLVHTDKIITVSKGLKKLFLSKSATLLPSNILVLPNGFDPEDLPPSSSPPPATPFRISYTGSMSDQYEPYPFLDAMRRFVDEHPQEKIELKIVGLPSENITMYIHDSGMDKYTLICPYKPHHEAVKVMLDSHVLLLVIPVGTASGMILTGKLFEYLGCRRKIINLGPTDGDAAEIINECQAGKTFDRTSGQELYEYLQELFRNFKLGKREVFNEAAILKYSREYQAGKIMEWIQT